MQPSQYCESRELGSRVTLYSRWIFNVHSYSNSAKRFIYIHLPAWTGSSLRVEPGRAQPWAAQTPSPLHCLDLALPGPVVRVMGREAF